MVTCVLSKKRATEKLFDLLVALRNLLLDI